MCSRKSSRIQSIFHTGDSSALHTIQTSPNLVTLQVSAEKDGSVELQSVTAAFPGATSIKYRNPATLQVLNT